MKRSNIIINKSVRTLYDITTMWLRLKYTYTVLNGNTLLKLERL